MGYVSPPAPKRDRYDPVEILKGGYVEGFYGIEEFEAAIDSLFKRGFVDDTVAPIACRYAWHMTTPFLMPNLDVLNR